MSKTIYPATLMCDFYKVSHREQYPEGTEYIYSTWIPRSNKHFPQSDYVVAFGFQAFIKEYLINYFNKHFFDRPQHEVVAEYTRVIKHALGIERPPCVHIAKLHTLGYLPIEIKAIPEGTKVPFKTPLLTIQNTHPEFFWVTNYLETLISCELWQPTTSATIASQYRDLLNHYAMKTVGNTDFVPFQGHDFSMRGMSGFHSAAVSGTGHLLSFVGTDTVPAISRLEEYYGASIADELVGTSIPATEHSVMCAGGDGDDEFETYKRLITEVYPSGFVSIVSDTWDLWNTITNILPKLKQEIMRRDGKVVIRPDSGDPVDIICGTKHGWDPYDIRNGVIQLLWNIFGGTVNDRGYKELDPHIGCIYGDAITLDRCEQICKRLEASGFASTNVVYGIGSYTYQYNTRDTLGFAMKSTLCVINGEEKAIYKDPFTDDGTKKSLTGAVAVVTSDDGDIGHMDGLGLNHEIEGNLLTTIFKNGWRWGEPTTLSEIRQRLLRSQAS